MKVFLIVILLCFCCLVWGTASETTSDFDVENILPKSLVESLQQQKQRHGRILNGLQYVQHSPEAHSVYLPPTTANTVSGGLLYSANSNPAPAINTFQQVSQKHIVDLQVPTSADDNKILVHLPTQKLALQQNSFGVPPPRRHYRITLVRSRATVTPPPQTQSSEVEEKTLIYVLVKKSDESTAAAQLEELQKSEQNNIKHNAPEVYFIKYKENSNTPLPNTPQQYLHSTNAETHQSDDVRNENRLWKLM